MTVRSRAIHGFSRTLGVIFVTLSLVHTPLPQPDFHNIRHHDGPGEVCEFHDHLLRWHPGAGVAGDVAILHWHWFLPSEPEQGETPAGNVPAIHAHAPDWQSATLEAGPRIAPDAASASRLIPRPAPSPLDFLISPTASAFLAVANSSGMYPKRAFSATFAPGVRLSALHQRWDC